MKSEKAEALIRGAGSTSLILFPLVLMLAFAGHFESFSDFFVFELQYESNTATEFMDTLINPAAARRYTIAHGVGYLGLPLIISTALYLSFFLFKARPWYALIGGTLSCIGTVYMAGVFGAWLSFAAVGNVTADQVEGAIPVLEALMEMQGPLLVTSILSALSLIGLMVIAAGLFVSQVVPRWSAVMVFLGNLLILVFMDLDNWMFLGAFIMLLGLAPISLKLLKPGQYEEV